MNEGRIAPFGRDFDEAMVKAGGVPMPSAAVFQPRSTMPAAPLERLESALDELAGVAEQVSSMAYNLAGPGAPQHPKSGLREKDGPRARPDGLFNRMLCIAADISVQVGAIRDQVERINTAQAGLGQS